MLPEQSTTKQIFPAAERFPKKSTEELTSSSDRTIGSTAGRVISAAGFDFRESGKSACGISVVIGLNFGLGVIGSARIAGKLGATERTAAELEETAERPE